MNGGSKLLCILAGVCFENFRKQCVTKENTISKSETSEPASNYIEITPSIEKNGTNWKITISEGLKEQVNGDLLKKIAEPIMDAHSKERVAYYQSSKWWEKAITPIVIGFVLCCAIYCSYDIIKVADNNKTEAASKK